MKSTALFVRLHVLLLSGLGQSAYAVHPSVTDDTSTQGRHRSQIEMNVDQVRFAGETGRIAAFTYTYGATDALDIYGNLPVSLPSPSGRDDLSFGAKWRFWQAAASSLAISPELFLPTGNELKGLGNGSPSLNVTLLASHVYRRWGFDANLGFTANHYKMPTFDDAHHTVVWRASAALAYRLNEKWTVVADAGLARNIEKAVKTNPAFVLIGVIFSPPQDVDVDIGIKAGLNAAEDHRRIGAGLTMRF